MRRQTIKLNINNSHIPLALQIRRQRCSNIRIF
ncbi:hypothetical protein EMIT0373P_10163 [Pseudomonas chlororaphis]